MDKKMKIGGNYMNGASAKKDMEKERKVPRHMSNPYKNVKLVHPVGKPSIPEKEIADVVHLVREKYEKAAG